MEVIDRFMCRWLVNNVCVIIILTRFTVQLLSHLQVDNTDAEGRLLLADALCYAHSFSPSTIVDLATLTGAIDVALGSGAAAVFTTDDDLWSDLHQVLLLSILLSQIF